MVSISPKLWFRCRRIVQLFLVFQPAICRTDNISVVRKLESFHEFFQFRKQIEVTWSQDNASDHTSAQALDAIQNAGFVYSITVFAIRIRIAWQMAGWKTKNNTSISESELWRNAEPSAFRLHETMLKSNKIWCAYLIANCVSPIRTFRTPLVQQMTSTTMMMMMMMILLLLLMMI